MLTTTPHQNLCQDCSGNLGSGFGKRASGIALDVGTLGTRLKVVCGMSLDYYTARYIWAELSTTG